MIWGVYFGIILLCEKLFLLKALSKLPKFVRHIYALLLIVIGWGIFAFDDFGKLSQNFKNMFGLSGIDLVNDQALSWLATYAITFVILIIASTPLVKKLGAAVSKGFPVVYSCVVQPVMVAAILILSTAYLAGGSFNPFLYFRF
jgi:alginate O-acetyltransferase complex protein AlgI